MTTDVRPIEAAELAAWMTAMQHGFHIGEAGAQRSEWVRSWIDLDRTLGAFDRGRVVGTLRSFASELTPPDAPPIPVDAITNATVAPTHRRRGLLTAMLAEERREALERGDAISMLIASEYGIYGRFGFGPATRTGTLTVDTALARFRQPGTGEVELVDPTELRRIAPPIHEALRQHTPGAVPCLDHWWDDRLGLGPEGDRRWRGRAVVCRDAAGTATGYVRYRVEERWDGRSPAAVLTVDDLHAVDPGSAARLWRYCCEVDLVRTVRAEDRPLDDTLPWFLEDARVVRWTDIADMLWIRVLDPRVALAGRGYGAAGDVVIRVVDPDGPADGTYHLTTSADGAECRRSRRAPALTLPVSSLGSLLLGGTRLPTLVDAGLAELADPRTGPGLGALFAGEREPWNDLWF